MKINKKLILSTEEKYELLKNISYQIRSTLDLDDILNHILDELEKIIKYDAAGIFKLSSDLEHSRYHLPKQMIAGIAKRGFDEKPPENDSMLTSGKGVIGYVIKSGECVLIPDVRHDSRYIVGREKTLSEIAVPIFRNNIIIGALDIESDKCNAFDEKDLEILQFFANAASISIEKSMLHLQILHKNKIEEQLQLAKKVQSSLLPVKPPEIKGYDIAGLCIPTYEIGGDYFDYINFDNDNTAITVADVSGHGIPAALIMTAFRALLRTHSKNINNSSEIMELLNVQIADFTRKRDFITAFYGILNHKKHFLNYTNCGHNPPLLFRSNGKIEFLKTGGPSLNILTNSVFDSDKIKINKGDVIIMFTDGVIETFDKNCIEFGLERLVKSIKKFVELSAEEIINKIVKTTKEYSCCNIYDDDYTIVIIKRI